MGEYKRFIQNQFEKVKSTASDLISTRSDGRETAAIGLDAYEALKKIADAQNTSVQALVNHIINEHLSATSLEPIQITVDNKEENPLLYLDAICKFED
jgi:predicted DNA-binding ribbon-helix-helix protein